MTSSDTFISDEDEDLCPLCIEEMDISDKNFRPCPCGYQICQFCYNNIRQNPELNGRCPACRRIYDDESVEYKQISTEEWRKDHLRQARKEKERKQREREKKETDQQASKKHLAGMRVIQKNLVYVIGLNPNIATDDLHETLRGDQFFGQYGKIQKIVVNKRTNASGNPGIGVYVTFARKEDAARCIAAVDGSVNDGKYLRAAYGTTKYCSSYLRGQTCPNPNCMFLHEPGEEADSYTRRDLSAMQHRHNHSSNPAGTSAPPNHQSPSGLPSLASASGPTGPTGFPIGTPTNSVPPSRQASISGPSIPASVAVPTPVPAPVIAAPPTIPSIPLSAISSSGPTPTAAAPLPVASAWGKPPVTRTKPAATAEEAVPEVGSALKSLNRSFETLTKGAVGFVFSSRLLSDEDLSNAQLPPYFSLALSDEGRHSIYTEFAKELAEFTPSLAPSTPVGPIGVTPAVAAAVAASASPVRSPAITHASRIPVGVTSTPSPAPAAVATPPPGLFASPAPGAANAQNSHELLAHLLKVTPQTEARLHKQLDKFFDKDEDLIGTVKEVADSMGWPKHQFFTRTMPAGPTGQEPMGPVPQPQYIDDGPMFDIRDLPEDTLVGDSPNSVWSAIEKRNRYAQSIAERTQTFTTSQNTVRRLMAKMGVV